MLVSRRERVGRALLRDAESSAALADGLVGVRRLVLVHVDGDDERVVVRSLRIVRRAHSRGDIHLGCPRVRLVVLEADRVVEAGRRAVDESARNLRAVRLNSARLVGVEARRLHHVAAASVRLSRHPRLQVTRGEGGHYVSAV